MLLSLPPFVVLFSSIEQLSMSLTFSENCEEDFENWGKIFVKWGQAGRIFRSGWILTFKGKYVFGSVLLLYVWKAEVSLLYVT